MENKYRHFYQSVIFAYLFICFLTSIDAWGLTSDQLETDIRDATTGCPGFTVTLPAVGSGIIKSAAFFGVNANNTGAQNYTDFLNAINYCKTNPFYELKVPTGTYYIGDSNSSYGNGIFYFNHLTNFVFEGGGSTFICQSKSDFVVVRYCSQVALQNYTMNWDWSVTPVQSLTEVVNIATNGTYIDLYYPYESKPATSSLLYELDEVEEEVGVTNGEYETNYDFSHQGAGIVGVGDIATSETTNLGNSTLRFYTSHGDGWFYNKGARVGQYYLLRHYSYEYPGNDVEYNNNLTYSNVTVYSTLGMGFSLVDNQYWQIIDSRLIREPGSIYHLSSASDGINNSLGYGYFKLQNDELGNCGDDNINIHDDTSEGVNVTGANTLIASNCVNWRNPFTTGDIVELRKGDYTPWSWSSALTSVSSYSNNDTVKLTFADNLPAGLTANSILFNHTYNSGNYIISGCYIHDSKGKGAFLHTANGTVENNQFIRNYNPGLFIASINSYSGLGSSYGEGYDPENIIVENNTFDGNNIIRNNGVTDTYFPNDIVLVGQTGPDPIATYSICNNIIFEYNLVANSTHASMEIGSATNVLVQNNTFENPCLTNDMTLLGCVIITNSGGIVFNNNALVIDPGVTSYKTNVYVAPSLPNIFVEPFTNVSIGGGLPIISGGPDDIFSYSGTTNVLAITVSGTSPFWYQWYEDGLAVIGATNSSYTFAVLPGTNTYYCAVTNSYNVGAPTLSSTATVAGVAAPETLNSSDFSYKLKIQFTGYSNRDEALEDFPVLVQLGTNVPGFSNQEFASPNGADLRFADSSGTVSLPYEIDQWNSTNSTVWVQVPSLSGTNDFIWAYWGNPADTAPPDYTTNGAVWLPPTFQSLPSYDVVYHLEQTGFPYLDSTLQYPAINGIAPASVTGLIGEGLSFNKTPYLDAGLVNLGNAFTLSAWVNVPASAYSIQTVWGNGNGVADSPECEFYVDNYNTSDGTLTLTTGDGSTQDKLQSAAGAVSFGQWHLITAVADRADGNAQLYVDGNQVAAGAALTDFPTNTEMDLGRDNGNSYQYTGLIDEARIHSGLESSNWVWASYMTVIANSSFESYSAISSSVVTLGIQMSGNKIILTWPQGVLQSASAVTGPYSDVPTAASPYTNTVTGTQEFYRVRVQ